MAATANTALALRRRMAELSGTRAEDWFLVTKARQGMQVAFSAARTATGSSKVVTQLFTCITAVNPILAAGCTPVYVDVDPQTLSVDARGVAPDARGVAPHASGACAVVLQHTFGLVDDTSSVEIANAAHEAGAICVEDSAHCVGRMARDEAGIPLADVSVHSFGVEKILAGTYFGGAVWVNPQSSKAEAMRRAFMDLPAIDRRLQKATRSYLNQIRIITRLPQGAAQALRARWERKGTFEPAVSDGERRGKSTHEPSVPDEWICGQALAALEGLESNERNRRACVQAYLEAFDEATLAKLRVPDAIRLAADQPLLRFPVFLGSEGDANAAAANVADLGFYVPAWPRPLLVPGMADPAPYGLASGMDAWPHSQSLSDGVVALPTDIDPANIASIVRAVTTVNLSKE